MIFARYNGADSRFIPGKLYIAKEEMDCDDVVLLTSLEVTAETGEIVTFTPREQDQDVITNNWDFEFFGLVYAVVVKPFGDFVKGQVVVVENVDIDAGKMVYEVQGFGFQNYENLILVDKTNLFPGMKIMDENTGIWCKVKSVNEAMQVVTECSDLEQSPESFRFSVDEGGDIQVEPYRKCVSSLGVENEVTKGRYYKVIREHDIDSNLHLVTIIDDNGEKKTYIFERFI